MAKKGVIMFFVCLLYLIMLAAGLVLVIDDLYSSLIIPLIEDAKILNTFEELRGIFGYYFLLYVPTVLIFINSDADMLNFGSNSCLLYVICVALQIAGVVFFCLNVETALVLKIVIPIYVLILDFTVGAFGWMNTIVRTVLIPFLPILHAPIAPIMFFVDCGVMAMNSSSGSSSSSSSKSSESTGGSYYGDSSSSTTSSSGGGICIHDEYGNTLTLTYWGKVWIYGAVNTEYDCYRDNLGNYWISDDGGQSFYRKPTLNCSF